jgi:hypothetical protein
MLMVAACKAGQSNKIMNKKEVAAPWNFHSKISWPNPKMRFFNRDG